MAEVSDHSESTHRIDGRRSQEEDVMAKREDRIRKEHNHSLPRSHRHMELDEYQLPIYPNDRYRYSAQVHPRRTQETVVPTTVRRTIDNFELIKDLGR